MEQIRKRNADSPSCRAESAKPGWTLKEHCYKFTDVIAVMATIVVLWLIMSLPTIIYIRHTIITEVGNKTLILVLSQCEDQGRRNRGGQGGLQPPHFGNKGG